MRLSASASSLTLTVRAYYTFYSLELGLLVSGYPPSAVTQRAGRTSRAEDRLLAGSNRSGPRGQSNPNSIIYNIILPSVISIISPWVLIWQTTVCHGTYMARPHGSSWDTVAYHSILFLPWYNIYYHTVPYCPPWLVKRSSRVLI